MLWALLIIIILLLLLSLIAVARSFVNDDKIPAYTKKINLSEGVRIMYVFAHPDDEVLISGTLAMLKKKYNASIKALYLTHGEDGPTGGIVEKADLKQERAKELNEVKRELDIDEMVIKDYPDRHLNTINKAELVKVIRDEAAGFNPDYIITTDDVIGLYGHTDHIAAGAAAKEAVSLIPSVKGLLVMTLPKQMIKLAMKMSKTFRERFTEGKALPSPNVAFMIWHERSKRLAVTRFHRTQHEVMRDLQPYYEKLPAALYYAVFNKEYYEYTDENN
jgi:LmbE family N-acetylglucosaminyl deacetylase